MKTLQRLFPTLIEKRSQLRATAMQPNYQMVIQELGPVVPIDATSRNHRKDVDQLHGMIHAKLLSTTLRSTQLFRRERPTATVTG